MRILKHSNNNDEQEEKVVETTNDVMGDKRVLTMTNCHGAGFTILSPSSSQLTNAISQTDDDDGDAFTSHSTIKLFIESCSSNLIIKCQCKVITQSIEISHCSVTTLRVEKEKNINITSGFALEIRN